MFGSWTKRNIRAGVLRMLELSAIVDRSLPGARVRAGPLRGFTIALIRNMAGPSSRSAPLLITASPHMCSQGPSMHQQYLPVQKPRVLHRPRLPTRVTFFQSLGLMWEQVLPQPDDKG